ncbi:precorrin-6y C5,15-methyltransferase (decarboxylating) subunit CbiE [Parabacteroides sp. OttesenSCG-928-G21]|nr:precorrin-6y C5,15-methyltransferase (decarboxylating) subunit CbiE [Parabacteroides sp. OttesenSCG-928-G21]
MNTFYVIGLNENVQQLATPDVTPILSSNFIFSGGIKQQETVRSILPKNSTWININIPFNKTFDEYEKFLSNGEDIVLFVTGDPAFFDFTSSLYKRFPDTDLKMMPAHNVFQTLAQHLMIPYHDIYMANFEDHTWHDFDFALIKGKPKIGVSADKIHSPSAIAERMMEYGYNNYTMYVGEYLNDPEMRTIRKMSLVSASSGHFNFPNSILLVKEYENPTQLFGIPDHYFSRVMGEENKITERPVRLMSLSMLELKSKKNFWDIGFCTGSVAIEARLQFPHLHVTGFDIEEECGNLMAINSCRCGAPGIHAVIGDFCNVSLSLLPPPDAVFIGGHGGKLIEMVSRIAEVAESGCIIVFCSLNEESNVFFQHACTLFSLRILEQTRMTIDSYSTCTIYKAINI